MDGIIKVTPEKLISTAEEFSTVGQNVNTLTQSMTEMVNGLSSTWTGEAANAYRTKFSGLQDDITKLNNMIQEHAADLTKMGETYQRAETANEEELANSLPTDVIQ